MQQHPLGGGREAGAGEGTAVVAAAAAAVVVVASVVEEASKQTGVVGVAVAGFVAVVAVEAQG